MNSALKKRNINPRQTEYRKESIISQSDSQRAGLAVPAEKNIRYGKSADMIFLKVNLTRIKQDTF